MDEKKNQRPEGFEQERRDCTVRALSLVANISYEKVHNAWENAGRKNRKGIVARKVLQKVCKSLNLEAKQVKRSGTLKKLIVQYPEGKLFCLKRGHAFALIDGVIHDENRLSSHIKGAWLISRKVRI